MTDQPTPDDTTGPVCPWCSAALSSPDDARCPSCGAALTSEADDSLPGLTAIDAGAILRAKQVAVRPKSRLFSWLSGDDGDETFTKAEGNALEPPDDAVRRVMMRMELEAEVASLQAENDAILAEAVAEGRVVEVPPELAEVAGVILPGTAAADIGTGTETVADAPVADAPAAEPDVPAEPEAPAEVADVPADAPAAKGNRKRS